MLRDVDRKRKRRGFALGGSQLGIYKERQVVDVVVREVRAEVVFVEPRARVGFVGIGAIVGAAGDEDCRGCRVAVGNGGGLDESDIIVGIVLRRVDFDADAAWVENKI